MFRVERSAIGYQGNPMARQHMARLSSTDDAGSSTSSALHLFVALAGLAMGLVFGWDQAARRSPSTLRGDCLRRTAARSLGPRPAPPDLAHACAPLVDLAVPRSPFRPNRGRVIGFLICLPGHGSTFPWIPRISEYSSTGPIVGTRGRRAETSRGQDEYRGFHPYGRSRRIGIGPASRDHAARCDHATDGPLSTARRGLGGDRARRGATLRSKDEVRPRRRLGFRRAHRVGRRLRWRAQTEGRPTWHHAHNTGVARLGTDPCVALESDRWPDSSLATTRIVERVKARCLAL